MTGATPRSRPRRPARRTRRTPGHRPSLRARALLRSTTSTLKQYAAGAEISTQSLRRVRRILDLAQGAVTPPLRTCTIQTIRDGEIRGEWVRPSRSGPDAAVLYVHGGGFISGSARGYRGIATRLAQEIGVTVFVVDYRLAPEHPYPAADNDVRAAYDWLCERLGPTGRVIVMGDSAGAHLAAKLVCNSSGPTMRRPSGLVLLSPMTDLSLNLVSPAHADDDGLLTMPVARAAVDHYLQHSEADVEVRPTAAVRPPPTLIQAGASEFFTDDAVELAARIRNVGTRCDLQLWAGQLHVFQLLPTLVPEAAAAVHAVGDFVRPLISGTLIPGR